MKSNPYLQRKQNKNKKRKRKRKERILTVKTKADNRPILVFSLIIWSLIDDSTAKWGSASIYRNHLKEIVSLITNGDKNPGNLIIPFINSGSEFRLALFGTTVQWKGMNNLLAHQDWFELLDNERNSLITSKHS